MDYYDTEYKDPVTNRGKIIIILTSILLLLLALFLIGYLTGNIHFGKTNTISKIGALNFSSSKNAGKYKIHIVNIIVITERRDPLSNVNGLHILYK